MAVASSVAPRPEGRPPPPGPALTPTLSQGEREIRGLSQREREAGERGPLARPSVAGEETGDGRDARAPRRGPGGGGQATRPTEFAAGTAALPANG